MKTITIFRYLDDLDCFVVSDKYQRIADQLGRTEWSPLVWIGRLFTLDNDYGEHWFDDWRLREPLEEAAVPRGLSYEELLSSTRSASRTATTAPATRQRPASASGPMCCARWS